MANLFGNTADVGQLQNFLLLRLNRIYCTLAVGATIAISFELLLETGYADSLEIQRSRCFILVLVLFLLAGAFVCGLYIARQAKIFARKSEELLFEAKQRAASQEPPGPELGPTPERPAVISPAEPGHAAPLPVERSQTEVPDGTLAGRLLERKRKRGGKADDA